MNKQLLYYDCLTVFKKQFYKDLLTQEHLKGEFQANKIRYTDGTREETANFWGWELFRNGEHYIIPNKDSKGKTIKIEECFPIKVNCSQKVAIGKEVYTRVTDFSALKFQPLQTMSFKKFIDTFSTFDHSNPEHQKLNWFIAFTQMMDRANMRVSTPAGFGKDSSVDILGNLIGNAATIENPTLAKLEFMTFYKWLAVNEVVDIGSSEWRNIEQFLLAAGAFKPEITKHSRAMIAGSKDILNISEFSLSLMYNDIDHYPDQSKYFDFVAKDAVKNRFPPMRLWGTLKEDFNSIKGLDIELMVSQSHDIYKELLNNYTFYKQNMIQLLHKYDCSGLVSNVPERWKINMGKLLNIIDLYCETQEEFNHWLTVINHAMADYQNMLTYAEIVKKYSKRIQAPEVFRAAREKNTYADKIQYIEENINVRREQKEDPTTFWNTG